MSENPQSPRDVPGNPDQPPPSEQPTQPPPSEQPTILPAAPPFDQAPFEPPPSPFAPMGPPPPPVPSVPAKKKMSTGKIIALVAGGLVVLALVCVGVLVWVAYSTFGDRVQNAGVGDCLPASVQTPGVDITKIDKVDCGSADAVTKIVGVVENRGVEELATDTALCTEFPNASSKFWVGEPGKKGKVFCLEPIK